MKAKETLTPRSIKALEAAPKGKRVLIRDATVQGFAVRVTDTGSKSFVVVTRYPGDKHLASAGHSLPATLQAVPEGSLRRLMEHITCF